MKLKLPLIAAFFAISALTACGSDTPPTPLVAVESPAALTKTDVSIGTGADAVAGKTVKVNYTGWLYTTKQTNFKGTQFDTSVGKTPFQFKLAAGTVIPGFDQAVTGMKVGGKRTVLIPAALGYGASGSGNIPPNSGLVFDIELLEAL